MKQKEFDDFLQSVISEIQTVLGSKGNEYSKDNDRLYNFKSAAVVDEETPEKALWGMFKKHLVSIKDIKDNVERFDNARYTSGKILITKELVDEKLGDGINYLILLKALLYERFGWK